MHTELVTAILILLLLSVVAIMAFRRLALPAIIAYLGVGMIAGPHGIGLIGDSETVRLIAEFGVVFLLFTLGMEFSLPRLVAMRRAVLGMGSAQVVLTAGAIGLIAWLVGFSPQAAFVLAGVAAVSSTAIVIKQLGEQLEINSPHGNNAVGVLLFQDLAVIPFLIIIPLLGATAATSGSAIGLEIARTLGIGAVVTVLLFLSGRWLLRPLFSRIAATGSAELFTIAVLFVVLAAAWLTHEAGLSYELGAFLAGLALSETRFREQIEADIRPFRDVLLGLFFITIGMLLNVGGLPAIIGWVLLLLTALVIIKTLIIFLIGKALGDNAHDALRSGILLAQGGEFGFVMLALAAPTVMDGHQMQIVLATIIFSMLLTPILVRYNGAIANLLLPRRAPVAAAPAAPDEDVAAIAAGSAAHHDHVILCGFGRVGQGIGRLIEKEGFDYLALERDPRTVKLAGAAGLPVFLGGATRPEVLKAAGIERARVLLITHGDLTAALRTTEVARSLAPDLTILVRTDDEADMRKLLDAGASEVIPARLETSLILASHVLGELNVPMDKLMRQLSEIRRERYGQLTHTLQPGHGHPDAKPNAPMLQSIRLGDGDWAVGKTLGMALEGIRGVEVDSLRRNGIRGELPEADTRLRQGDIVVLYGPADALTTLRERMTAPTDHSSDSTEHFGKN